MLRGGGRGGQVRLKLYLSYLWVQRDDQARELSIRNGAWATLFDLKDPQTAGARRIGDAQAWLEENNFISLARTGRQNLVTVLSETGNGAPWIAPGAAAKKEKEEGSFVWPSSTGTCRSRRRSGPAATSRSSPGPA